MKNLIKITLLLTILLYACKKDKIIEPTEETTITLTGKIVYNCAGDPIRNRSVKVFVAYGDWNTDILDAKTDTNGNFEWTFDKKKSIVNITLRVAGIGDILTFEDKHRNLGTIIATPTCNVVMKIKVNNPYSLGDTLRLKDFPNHPTLKGINITAPFRDTVLTPAYNYSELSWPDSFEDKNTTYVSSIIYI